MRQKEDNKSREPYKPEETPKPPHVMDPNSKDERPPDEEASPTAERKAEPATTSRPGNTHLLSEEADIDDETTI